MKEVSILISSCVKSAFCTVFWYLWRLWNNSAKSQI